MLDGAVLFFAGVLTGVVNTVAGSGTIFSLGTMVLLGIPIEIANTTNRLGVLFQNIAGVVTFRRFGSFSEVKLPLSIVLSTLCGAGLGAFFAATIQSKSFESIALIVIMLMSVQTTLEIIGRTPALRRLKMSRLSMAAQLPLFFFIGFYGGLIQIGVGILLLLGLRSFLNLKWNESNYFKLLVVLIYTVPTLAYFIWVDMIEWKAGLVLAFGQIFGAYMAARVTSINLKLQSLIPYFVLVMLLLTAIRILLS